VKRGLEKRFPPPRRANKSSSALNPSQRTFFQKRREEYLSKTSLPAGLVSLIA